MAASILKAEFSQHRNDLYWKHFDLEDGRLSWTGYDDDYWWNNVAKSEKWKTRIGSKSGATYTLDPATDRIDRVNP